MTDVRTGKNLKDFPILENGEIYIYVMENDDKKIKIGKTSNIQQRYQSLCGSNSQGIPITRVFVSDSTYLYTIERIMHDHFEDYRIKNTEWFNENITFKDAVIYLLSLFSSVGYKKCNELRKKNTLNDIKRRMTCQNTKQMNI